MFFNLLFIGFDGEKAVLGRCISIETCLEIIEISGFGIGLFCLEPA